MSKIIMIVLFIGILLSCKNRNEEAVYYYKDFSNLFLEFELQRKEAISSGNKLLKLNYNYSTELDSQDFVNLLNQYDSFAKFCKENKRKIESIGPFYQDSSLLHASSKLYTLSESIFKNEFPKYFKTIQEGKICHSCEKDVQDALLEYIELQTELLKTEIEFQNKNNLDIHLREIESAYLEHVNSISKAELMIEGNNDCLSGDCDNGFGKSKDSEGSIYTGYFKNGLFHGEGKIEYTDGESYTGNFINGDFGGYGVYKWNSGAIYKGEWKGTLLHGKGTMIYEDGDTVNGIWKNDKLVKEIE